MQVKGELNGDILTLTIDCSEEARARAAESKSGKTRILASTHGFVKFGDVSVSVNATLAKPRAAKDDLAKLANPNDEAAPRFDEGRI